VESVDVACIDAEKVFLDAIPASNTQYAKHGTEHHFQRVAAMATSTDSTPNRVGRRL